MSSSSSSSQSFHSFQFTGHQAPVLCLDTSPNEQHLLLSGSEDGTARLWDLRDHSKRRACLCLSVGAEVLSVAFAPTPPPSVTSPATSNTTEPDATSPFAQDHTIFLSVENHVVEYDLRHVNSPIVTQPTRNWSSVLQNQDEVNQLALMYHQPFTSNASSSKKSKKKRGSGGSKSNNNLATSPSLFVAAADDAGTVRFMDWSSQPNVRENTPIITTNDNAHSQSNFQSHILHHDPNGVAVVPACAFRPCCTKGLELASGGTDCKIQYWDLSKPKRPVSSYTIQALDEIDGPAQSNKPQVCNPPMVYSLAWSPSGRLLAAGLGDGNIPIFSVDNRNLVQTGFLPDGHDSSVASVLFPSFAQNHSVARDRVVLSGGSDGSILCWDIGSNVLLGDDGDDEPENVGSQLFPDSMLQNAVSSAPVTNDGVMQDLSQKAQAMSLDTDASSQSSRILFGIPHGAKINWMTTTSGNPASIFVADTSNDITGYTIPLR